MWAIILVYSARPLIRKGQCTKGLLQLIDALIDEPLPLACSMADADSPWGPLGYLLPISTTSLCSSQAGLGRRAFCRRAYQRSCLHDYLFQPVGRQTSRTAQDCGGKAVGSTGSCGKAVRRPYCSQEPRENIKHSMPNRASFQISLPALFALFRQNKELKYYKASAALEPTRHPLLPGGPLALKAGGLWAPPCSSPDMGWQSPPRHALVSSRATPTTTAFCGYGKEPYLWIRLLIQNKLDSSSF